MRSWARDVHESGIWLAFAIVLVIGVIVGILDVRRWSHELSVGILAEANAVVVELFIAGVVIAVYDYRRRRLQEVRAAHRELSHLRLSDAPASVIRKAELIDSLAALGRRPASLEYCVLSGARLNGFDLSAVGMRFGVLRGSMLIRASLMRCDLFAADLAASCLVEADLTGANLSEANLGGARLAGAVLTGADVDHADLRGARELTCEQLTSARNWQSAYREETLACGAAIPAYEERAIGQKLRELYRQIGNPTYPYVLARLIELDGSERTIVDDDVDEAQR